MNTHLLEKIGLTKSEIKVYLALIDLGSSSVGPITKKARVASSKTYELLNKLIQKGLVTTFKENNVNYFKSVNPYRLKDYLEEKKKELKENETELSNLLPTLELKFREHVKETEVELFKGYKGIQAIFKDMIKTLNKGDEFLVIGGGDTPPANPTTRL